MDLKFIMSERKTAAAKAKVFCAFHPHNRKIALQIMKDVVSACECTVFYVENGECSADGDRLEEALSEMNLFVTVISSEYLFTESFARDAAYPFAVDHMIPILPIMIENGLEKPFNERMGSLQYLLFHSEQYDVTSIPYREKLENYLSRVLSAGEEKRNLRKAFDASIFLSYRKKDRRYAQDLIRLIHGDESCRGISIWYDEFLVPGEAFDAGIKDELESSTVVILVVTPHIAEKDNYIILTEYPAALGMGKTVLPFEMSPTRRSELTALYSALPEVLPASDADAVRRVILESIEKLGIKPLESSAEKEYLRGLAYLAGICVEKNTRIGVQKILAAAENGMTEAMQTAVFMYRSGQGVAVSLPDAAFWQKRYIDTANRNYEENGSSENAEALATAYFELCEIYEQSADYEAAIEVYQGIVELCLSESLNKERVFRELCISAWIKCGALYMSVGKFFEARYRCFESALKKRQEQYDVTPSPLLRVMICEIYALLAECCEMCQNRAGAKTNALQLKKLIPSVDDAELIRSEDYTLVERILSCNNKLCHFYVKFFEDQWEEAFICIGASIRVAQKLVEISDCYASGHQLMTSYVNDGDQHANKKVENHLRAADAAYENALAEARRLQSQYDLTARLKRDLARILQKQAFVKLGLGEREAAAVLYGEALGHFRSNYALLDTPVSRKDLYDCIREAACAEQASENAERATELLLESVQLAEMNVAGSELAVYKKDAAASHELLAELYKKQWDMDSAFYHAKKQCELLRAVMQGTVRAGDVKLFANAVGKALSIAKLAGEFDTVDRLQTELKELCEKYKMFFE